MEKEEEGNKKLLFLKLLKEKYSDMKVHYINQTTKEIWKEEKILKDLTDSDFILVNLRKQRPNEIILDIEEKYKLEEIKKKLLEKKWNYEVWDTGSRGLHISLLFDNLGDLDLDLRNAIRKYVIKEFETDENLGRESQYLALEFSNHFKTGKQKVLLEKVINNMTSLNTISNEIIEYCKQVLELSKQEVIKTNDDEFKDFWKTDPYLKYVLSNRIIDGGRNDVLFKNLAIGLVRSGLNMEDIRKIAERIVENCPGKNIGEFMGWIEKANIGEITEFNKAELIKWSLKYKHPPLYNTVGEEDLEKLLNVKELWDIIWNNRIARQPIWKDLCFFNLLGTVIDERDEDYRIHVIFSSPSRSGKDEGINLVKEILDNLGYKTYKPSTITDKTLVGGVNQIAVEMNTKWGVDEDNMGEGKKKYKDPKEFGILEDAQWIAFGESESVFKPGNFNRNLHTILRQAMDKARYVEKGVTLQILKLHTNASFIFTTFSMKDIAYRLVTNGIFQRSLYYNKDLTDEDDNAILEHIIDTRFLNTKYNYDEKKYINLLCEKLKKIKLWYNINKKFSTFNQANELVKTKIKQYKLQYNILLPEDRGIMNSIVRGAGVNMFKFSVLCAIYKEQNYITIKDINEGFSLIEMCTNSVKDIIIKQDKNKKQLIGLLLCLRVDEKTTGDIHKELHEKLNIPSPNARVKLMEQAKNLKLIDEKHNGKFKVLFLTEKGKEEVGDL